MRFMADPFRIVDARPLGAPAPGTGDAASAILLALQSTLDPSRLEVALTSALAGVFRAARCRLLEDGGGSDPSAPVVREARSRGEALAAEGPGAVLCAPLAFGSLLLERPEPFGRPELALLASLTPQISLALRNAHLYNRATADPLTGLPNRQRFVAELEEAVATEGPLSLILLDLDHFKDKNDVYGRPVGDRSLSELGDLLRHLPVAAFARSGDDEFAVLLKVDAGRTRELAEDLRRTVDDRIFDERHEGIHLTLSAGVAERRAGEMPSGFFARAAEALASAKREGRNRVTLAR
jgi:diguanylate cyclase (GGDEF)-like protein